MYEQNIRRILERYKTNYIGKENLETTANQVTEDLMRIMKTLHADYGVELEGGRLVGLTNKTLQAWYDEMVNEGRKVTTRNKYVALLNPFLRWLVNEEILLCDISSGKEPVYAVLKNRRLPKLDEVPEQDRKQKHFTPEQVQRLMSEMPGKNKVRDRAIIALFLASGLRAEELCSMTIGSIRNYDVGITYLRRKGGAWKYVEISEFAYAFIERYLETRPDRDDLSAPLFMTQKNQPVSPNQIWKMLHYKEKQLGLASGVHILRHTFNTEAASKSRPEVARDLSNHTSLAITSRYIHTTHEERAQAVNSLSWANMAPEDLR